MCCAVHTLCFVVYGFKACGHTLVPNPPQQQRMQAQLSFETLLTHTDEQNGCDRQTKQYTSTRLISSYMSTNKQQNVFSCSYIHYVSLYMLYNCVTHVRQGSGEESDQ